MDLSANVNCHKFKVPLAWFVTIDTTGHGGALKTSPSLFSLASSSDFSLGSLSSVSTFFSSEINKLNLVKSIPLVKIHVN